MRGHLAPHDARSRANLRAGASLLLIVDRELPVEEEGGENRAFLNGALKHTKAPRSQPARVFLTSRIHRLLRLVSGERDTLAPAPLSLCTHVLHEHGELPVASRPPR